MTNRRLLPALFAAVLLVAAACGDDDDSGGDTPATEAPSTEAPSTESPNTEPSGGSPSIDSFELEDSVSCSGDTADVKAEWSTSNADGVDFAVDGEPVPANAGEPASGSGNVPVPCDGEEHEVTITAGNSSGETATDSKKVKTESS